MALAVVGGSCELEFCVGLEVKLVLVAVLMAAVAGMVFQEVVRSSTFEAVDMVGRTEVEELGQAVLDMGILVVVDNFPASLNIVYSFPQ